MGKLLEIGTFLDLLHKNGKSKLATIDCNDSIEKAVKLMLKEEYSQLPVMKGDKTIGVISYETLAKTIFSFAESKSKPPAKVRVKDCMEKTSKIFNIDDDLISLLNTLANKSYVLITKRSKVIDIITSYDALDFFRVCGEDFIILNDIESILRKIISEQFDSTTFTENAKEIFCGKRRKPKTVNDMEFADYSTFIVSNWDRFIDLFGQTDILKQLENARIIRNKVCHFKCSISQEDRHVLRMLLDLLRSKAT